MKPLLVTLIVVFLGIFGCSNPDASERDSVKTISVEELSNVNEESFKKNSSMVKTPVSRMLELPPPPPPPPAEEIEAIFKIVSPRLEFPGCEEHIGLVNQSSCCSEKYQNYIRRNLEYPLSALNDEVEGTVVVQFELLDSCLITEPKVVKSLTLDCNEEALRIIRSLPNYRRKTREQLEEERTVKRPKTKFSLRVKFELSSPSNQIDEE